MGPEISLRATLFVVALLQMTSVAAQGPAIQQPQPTPNSWSVLLPFIGGLMSGLIFAPLAEVFKDFVASRRSWAKQSTEIIQSVRYLLGTYSGFLALVEEAFGKSGQYFPERIRPTVRILKKYDLSETLAEKIVRLAELHPREARLSGVSQHLVSLCASATASLAAIQDIHINAAQPDPTKTIGFQPALITAEDRKLIEVGKESVRKLHLFVGSIYATKMGIDRLSLIADGEVFKFNQELASLLAQERQPGDG